jgi:hypothetical protein
LLNNDVTDMLQEIIFEEQKNGWRIYIE